MPEPSAENLAKAREITELMRGWSLPKDQAEMGVAIAAALDAVRAEADTLHTNCHKDADDVWNERVAKERARAEAVVKAATALRHAVMRNERRIMPWVNDYDAAQAAWEAR